MHNIDESFILPYDRLKSKAYRQTAIQKNIQYNENKQINKEENNEINKENNNNNNNQVRKIINLKNNKDKIPVFKKSNLKKSYKTTDLCIQIVHQFAFEFNKGFVTYKNIFLYEENVNYNEIFLIFYEKESNVSSSNTPIINCSESESSSSNLLRDSCLYINPMIRSSVFSGGIGTQKTYNMYNNSNSSSMFSGLGSCKITSADSNNSCLIFEQSDGDDDDEESIEVSDDENENDEV